LRIENAEPFSTVSVVAPFETVSFHEKLKLLSETLFAMMLLLICDVGGNLIDM